MGTSELKPCPFCGGEAWATADSAHSTAFYVGCDTDHCFGSLMWAENLTEAVQCWNTRTPDLAAEVLRLRAALAEADAHRRLLWDLLDDIDTLDDACKGDDAAFRKQAYAKQQRRYEISTSDGYTVSFARAALKGTE